MRIGFSLPFRYLSGTPMSRDEQLLAEAFGPPSACLELLRLRRVTSIELGRINANTDPGEVLLAAARVLDAGLGLTLHGTRRWKVVSRRSSHRSRRWRGSSERQECMP